MTYMELPKPGELVQLDFRTNKSPSDAKPDRPLKLVQWNIERGYKLEGIINELRGLDADIIALQEIDIACERSNRADTGRAIAEALQLNYVFLCEFEELHSPLRTPLTQGGGVHGNAILTKFDWHSYEAIEHSHHPVDWEDPQHGLAKREPRRGRRLTLTADMVLPSGRRLAVYCSHLEVFCGITGRVQQFVDILRHVRRARGQGALPVIMGDLNTMANGVARLSPHYCCDNLRWRTLGSSEAAWWQRHVFGVEEEEEVPLEQQVNQHLLRLGLPREVCRDAVNPGLFDPFDPVKDVTLDNPKYRVLGYSLMSGKLDWLLLPRAKVAVAGTSMGNHDYSLSDHKWLMAEVNLL